MSARPQSLLEIPIVRRTRRNHGLEHATIHLLSQRHPGVSLAGRSDARGFYLMGNLPTETVAAAAQAALDRLRAGESQLAIHPNCGTNFLTAGVVAGLAAFLALMGTGRSARSRLERLPTVFLASTAALIFTQPLGFAIQQRVTTSGEMGALTITEVKQVRRGRLTVHRVLTAG